MNGDPLAWLSGLESLGVKLGIQTITALVEELGHPERTYRSVHVAGTNGKGSVVAMVDSALRAAGYRSACYTSPHLMELSERFVVDGRPVGRAALAQTVAEVRGIVERLHAGGHLSDQPTFFEVTTAVAFELFRRAGVDTAVCEVGMGGRLDATNILQPVACAVTSIGLDHLQHLGRNLRDIAFEKAGILKPSVPVIVGRLAPEALQAIELVAGSRGAPVVQAWQGTEAALLSHQAGRGPSAGDSLSSRIRLRTPLRAYGELALGLAGAHQVDNAVVGVRLLETLNDRSIEVPASAIIAGLRNARWPGRLDFRCLPDGREVLFDAAHNPDGAAALASFLHAAWVGKPPLVFAASEDKDVSGMLRLLAPAVSTVVLTSAENSRSADPSELATCAGAVAPTVSLVIESSLPDALAVAWRIAPRIVVAGSIFLLGDAMKELGLPW